MKKGFTIAELLIVVAIVSVLTFISIPIFAGKKDKANLAVDLANARSAKVAAISEYIFEDSGKEVVYFFDAKNGTIHNTSDGIEGYGQSSYKALQNMKDKSVYQSVFKGEPIDQDGNKNILKISISDDNVVVSWVPIGSGGGTTPDIKPSPKPTPTQDPISPDQKPIPTETIKAYFMFDSNSIYIRFYYKDPSAPAESERMLDVELSGGYTDRNGWIIYDADTSSELIETLKPFETDKIYIIHAESVDEYGVVPYREVQCTLRKNDDGTIHVRVGVYENS